MEIEPPVSRKLKVLAFDPSLSARLETTAMNQLVLSVPWEDLQPGPVGEYLEVIDHDPASGQFYAPVDLDSPYLLAQDGLTPSEHDPRSHQQMVYAVAMTTIRQFERALGRKAFWGDRRGRDKSGRPTDQFVRRLRIYPHALRERNAYYSPAKKSVLFGYFPATARDPHNPPETVVYTCLSHDIVAHEVTHALLDGVHPRFNEPTNPDVLAFHEAFADIVALFQHFSYPSVLQSQISRTRGDLGTENLLSQLAQQFGAATGRGGALRDALGGVVDGRWQIRPPNARTLEKTFEPHQRGAILVAAVFRAFLLIYRERTADLLRIASGGTGVLPDGELHPDLTKRLADEAAQCADRVLQMCIRAIDYCPPVNITFGDFLRAIITADLDYAPREEDSYRTVFAQTFREWGIHPRNMTGIQLDGLAWPSGPALMREFGIENEGANMKANLKKDFLPRALGMALEHDRFESWRISAELKKMFWYWLRDGDYVGRQFAEMFGLVMDGGNAPATVYRKGQAGDPTIEVHAVRPTIRRMVSAPSRTDLVIEVTQRRRGYFIAETQKTMDKKDWRELDGEKGDFTYRAGCTILIDPASQEVRRVIRTPGKIDDGDELERVRRFLAGEVSVTGNSFDAGLALSLSGERSFWPDEPFALLHAMVAM